MFLESTGVAICFISIVRPIATRSTALVAIGNAHVEGAAALDLMMSDRDSFLWLLSTMYIGYGD